MTHPAWIKVGILNGFTSSQREQKDKGTSRAASETYVDTSPYVTLNDFANSTAWVLKTSSTTKERTDSIMVGNSTG